MDEAGARKRAVRPRDAAGLVVVREGRGGAEVLMGLRAAGHRFMPNRLAFPGGRVERRDYAASASADLSAATRAMLEKSARPLLAHALGIAAARELAEETGLSLGERPALGKLFYLCRAITPSRLPMRFHARFLVVAAEALEGTLGGSGELEALRFYRLDETKPEALPWITAQVLAELATWLRLPAPARASVRETAVYRDRVRKVE